MPKPGDPGQQIANGAVQIVDVQPELIFDATSGKCWVVALTIAHPSGILVKLTYSPENARALGQQMSKVALECATKIVPADATSLIAKA